MTMIPDPIVAYADYYPVAVLHSQALLTNGSERIVAVRGDMRDPRTILADDDIRKTGFNLAESACVILACVLHFVDHGQRLLSTEVGCLGQAPWRFTGLSLVSVTITTTTETRNKSQSQARKP